MESGKGGKGGEYLDELLEDGFKVFVGAVVEGVDGLGALSERVWLVLGWSPDDVLRYSVHAALFRTKLPTPLPER